MGTDYCKLSFEQGNILLMSWFLGSQLMTPTAIDDIHIVIKDAMASQCCYLRRDTAKQVDAGQLVLQESSQKIVCSLLQQLIMQHPNNLV